MLKRRDQVGIEALDELFQDFSGFRMFGEMQKKVLDIVGDILGRIDPIQQGLSDASSTLQRVPTTSHTPIGFFESESIKR